MELQRFIFFIFFGLFFSFINLLIIKFIKKTFEVKINNLIEKIFIIFIPFFIILINIASYEFYSPLFFLLHYLLNLYPPLIINLLIITLLLKVFFFISRKINLLINKNIIKIISILIFLIISIYGIVNANNIRTTKINLKINNLPQNLKNKKIIYISDVHLGVLYGKDYLEKIINKINLENPEVVLIAGDLFDGSKGDLENIDSTFNLINSPTFFVSGNHDNYYGLNKINKILEKTKIKNLDDKTMNINNIDIHGISYLSSIGLKNNLNIFSKNKNLKIIIQHTPTNAEILEKTGANLLVSGHTHNGQFFPINLLTKLIFKKYNSGLNKINNLYMYTSYGIGTWGTRFRTCSYPEIVIIVLR